MWLDYHAPHSCPAPSRAEQAARQCGSGRGGEGRGWASAIYECLGRGRAAHLIRLLILVFVHVDGVLNVILDLINVVLDLQVLGIVVRADRAWYEFAYVGAEQIGGLRR